jgi:peptidylprolyl isomerase
MAVQPAARQGRHGVLPKPEERTPILRVRLGSEVPGLPTWQYLSTASASFARYVDARANRRDPFYVRPAGGVDICNAPVPIRIKP